jgi:hypothetical protein
MAGVSEAKLKEFLLREDVPAEDKKKAIQLYKDANGATPVPAPVPEATPGLGSAAGKLISEKTAAQSFDPGGSAHATSGEEEIAQGVEAGKKTLVPTVARTVGPAVGAIVGALTPIPGGAAAGAAIGAAAGDWIGQDKEIKVGLRTAYNPLRMGAELVTAGYFSKFQAGKTLMEAAAKGAIGNIGSETIISLADGHGLPGTFDLAMSGLAGGIMAGAGKVGEEVWQARRAAAKELSGSDVVAERIADFMGPVRTGEQLELKMPVQERLPLGPGEPTPPLVGPTQEPFLPKQTPRPTLESRGKAKKATALWDKKLSDDVLQNQMGFDDLEDGRTFEKLFRESQSPDQGTFDLKEAKRPQTSNVAQSDTSQASEYARMHARGLGKKEMLDTPLDRDPVFGDVGAVTKGLMVAGRPKDVFKRMEMETGFPVYEDYHNSSQAYRYAQMDVARDSKIAGDVLTGTRDSDQQAIFRSFMNGGNLESLPYRLRKKAATLWDIADKNLQEYDLSAQEYFGEFIPQVAKGKTMKQIIEEGTATSMIPKRLRFTEDAAQMLLSPSDPALIRVMNKLIDVGAYRRHVADVVAPMMEKYAADAKTPDEVKKYMNGYLSSLRGSTGDPSAETASYAFGMVAKKLGWNIPGDELVNKLIGASYTGLMGWRPASVIRNAMQTIQTGIPIFGVKSFAAGFEGALTKEGRKIAQDAGILAEGNVLHDVERATGRIMKTAFVPFQKAEDFNRTVAYLAGRNKFDRALAQAKKLAGDKGSVWDALLDKADIDMLSDPEQAVLAKMWDAGESVDKIRHTYAQGIVDDTQFMYLKPERAKVLQSQGGRILAGYANWSQGYASYMARMVGQGPPKKRARQLISFMGSNAVLAYGFSRVGGMLGDDDTYADNIGWTFLGPLFFSGGPILTTAQSLVDNSRKAYAGQTKPVTAASNYVKDVSKFLPAGGVMMDVWKAGHEPTKKEMFGRFLGFKRGSK